MIDKNQLSDLITRTLKGIGKYSSEAVNLLLGTAAQESSFGTYIRQLRGGPALGIFQMEPFTFQDICDNYLSYHPILIQLIKIQCSVVLLEAKDLEYNINLGICFARLQYLRFPETLPETIEGMAKLYKLRYNTPKGKATEEEFIKNYEKYIINYKKK